jgi:hypothetical protein
MDHVNLSQMERLLLSNQYKVLEALYPEEASDYAHAREIVERGYALEYPQLLRSVDHEVPSETSEHVLEVLNMYRALAFSNEGLPKAEQLPASAVGVIGFDGNNESDELSYARYFTRGGEKFSELTDEGKREIPNCHHPTRDMYVRMLRAWVASAAKNELTRPDIDRILAARTTR